MSPPPAGLYPPLSKAVYPLAVLTACWVLAYLDRQIIVMLVEPLRHDLGLSDTQISLLQGFAFSLFFVAAGLPLGRLVDRFNRRNILLLGLICWSTATFACGLATDFWQLFAARICVGVGEACLAPAGVSLVADLVASNRRGAAMGLVAAGTPLGTAGSFLLSGLILQTYGMHGSVLLPLLGEVATWQFVFFALATPGLPLALLLLTFREPVRHERAKPTSEARSLVRFVARHPAAFGLTVTALASTPIATYVLAMWTPVILMRVHHMPPGEVGALFAAMTLVAGVTTSFCGGAMSDWLARKAPRVGRLGVMLIAYPLMAALMIGWWFSDNALYAILAYGLGGPVLGNFVTGSTYPALNQLVPNELRGQTLACYQLVASLVGLGLAPTLAALITDLVLRDPTMLKESVILVSAPTAILGFACALLALRFYRKTCEDTAALIAEGGATE